MGIAVGISMLLFDAALRVKKNYAIYEKGARNAFMNTKGFFSHIFGHMPQSIVDEISENSIASAKTIVSDFIGEVLSHAGKIIIEFLMLALYVMFWLCTPMPLNAMTERIFRRYLLLKGSAC